MRLSTQMHAELEEMLQMRFERAFIWMRDTIV